MSASISEDRERERERAVGEACGSQWPIGTRICVLRHWIMANNATSRRVQAELSARTTAGTSFNSI